MKTTFWDSIVDFFKSISHKKPSGEPVNQNWEKNVTNQPKDPLTIFRPIAKETDKTDKTNAEAKIEIEPDPVDTPQEIELTPTVPEGQETLPPELIELQNKYPWRSLKAKIPFAKKVFPEPFYFIGKDKQPVAANRSEISFVKELLGKAAEAGVPNKFAFTLSSSNEIVVKYRYKLLGRAYLHGRKHRMIFKVDGNTLVAENLSLAQCKKLLLIWIGQIKEAAKSKEKAT